MRKSLGTGLFMVITTVVMFIPPVVAHTAGYPAIAGALVMPTVAAFLPALLADERTSLFAAVMVGVGSAVAVAVTGCAGKSNLTDAYIQIKNGEAWVNGMQITPQRAATTHGVADPTRSRSGSMRSHC